MSARPNAAAVAFDANSDGVLDVADGAWLLARNFRDGDDPPCLAAVEGFGDKVSDSGTAYAIWYALISGTAIPSLATDSCADPGDLDAACGDGVAFAITAPATASGTGTAEISASVELLSPNLPAEGWSVSVKAEGCTVVEATAYKAGLSTGQVSTEGGAVSLVVLDPIKGTTLVPSKPLGILDLRVETPVGSACTTCILSLEDGQAGVGRPLTNTVSSGGRSYAPATTNATIEVCPG